MGFSRGRWGGLVFPSLSEFSTVSCDPQVKGFGIVNKAKIDVFLELSCFFHDPADVVNLISGSSAFSKTSLNIWKFMVTHQMHKVQFPANLWAASFSSLPVCGILQTSQWHCPTATMRYLILFVLHSLPPTAPACLLQSWAQPLWGPVWQGPVLFYQVVNACISSYLAVGFGFATGLTLPVFLHPQVC